MNNLQKYFVLIALCIFANHSELFAQRDTQNILSSDFNEIVFDADEVFKINIYSENRETVKFNTHSEGEYFNNIQLKTKLDNGILILESQYPERLVGGFDKLSAHKVFSFEVDIYIPEGKIMTINSNSASIIIKGKFESLTANLQRGYCILKNFDGNCTVNTYKGDITAQVASGKVTAKSRNGEVFVDQHLSGMHQIKLTSINGDISVQKTK
ncbi:DUF4097 family beta strand repeat-containing protein [Zunongwangia sp. HGR-M22]|uniref:DUF4097 family beta strand repeat-containing protein n=1 Tax=Zunongwangia sp. HGR-M22 TaxID=3015168 RepID=UPI0022DD5DA5|nr:DUF4097 family beta strand repeat-containing protein [Zunongwangia sp. HGR-M22]WBL25553.1 DUF4097 family beta strand repeat-containing protein [Zunongwangia sp. HGR-M22]